MHALWLIFADEVGRPRHKPGTYRHAMDMLRKAINIFKVSWCCGIKSQTEQKFENKKKLLINGEINLLILR